MNDEAAFLEAIRADPGDATVRLVYADWLQDNEDPRAELVRVEEEVRHLAVFADRYWQLKPLRQELRSRSPQEWLTAMGYDGGPLLFAHGVPDGWRERWRLIREYIERWHGIPMPDVGGRADEIREVEERLGRVLPPSLREWVAFAHDVRRNPEYHDVIWGVYQMQDLEGHSALSLFLNREEDHHWAVEYSALDREDPPVLEFDYGDNISDRSKLAPVRRNPLRPTLSAFVFGYAVDRCHGIFGGFNSTDINRPERLLHHLKENFPVRTSWGGIDFYESDDFLVWVVRQSWESSMRLTVMCKKAITREDLPIFLRIHAFGGTFYGNTGEPDDIPF